MHPDNQYLNKEILLWVSSVVTRSVTLGRASCGTFCSYNFRRIHEDVENLKLRIAFVGTDHLQIYFLSSQDIQIITSAKICIGRIDQSKTFLEKDLSHFSRRRGQGNIIIL